MVRASITMAFFAAPILAQANAVPGLDISMYALTDMSYYGRQGAAYPNGEAGFMVGHSWCNSGTVNLPWQSVSGGLMVDQYPRIAFLLVRESGGRMVQITGQGHSKHSPTAYNFTSGPCAPCQSGAGSFFYVGCSDTYGSGINSSQMQLGPNSELNPWLGTWNPQGSYFDRGDPPVTGAQATDSIRSLTSTASFSPVKNRMVVREPDLIAGALYYSQVQAVVQGEPVANRGNNISNREISITGGGGGWNSVATGPDLAGSVLTRWAGATNAIGGNGQGDGNFVVAAKVTGPTAGMWHYEYAIHNVDNFRGGASFRVPVAPGATVQNLGFRDIDTDPLNDWTSAVNGNEIAFTAVGTNSLDWNTIYNCWFDCSVDPNAGYMVIDQARPGTGALSVQVATQAPSGLSWANKVPVGSSCGTCQASFYELFSASPLFDLGGRSMTMSLANGAYTVAETPVAFVPAAGTNLGLSLNGQALVTLPFALPYPGGSTTQLQVCASGYVSPGTPNALQVLPTVSTFLQGYRRWAAAWSVFQPAGANNVYWDANPTRAIATWSNVPFVGSTVPSTFQIQFFPSGDVNVVWQNIAPAPFPVMTGWTPGGGHLDPGSRDLSATLATPSTLCAVPFDGLTLAASANPVLGTTVQWQLSGFGAGTAWGVLMRSLAQATPPIDLSGVGMPGCFGYAELPCDATVYAVPAASVQIGEPIPNVTALVGVTLVGQALAYFPGITPVGLVSSNGMVLTVGL